jgi:hypothetical protein
MSEIIILNHCVPYPKHEFKPNFTFEIREEDKSEKKDIVGKILKPNGLMKESIQILCLTIWLLSI